MRTDASTSTVTSNNRGLILRRQFDKKILTSNMQTKTIASWKIANWTIFSLEALILTVGLFLNHISFGFGLGDIFWYGIITVALISHSILIVTFKLQAKWLRALAIIFSIFTIYVCLKATIWRGSEYSWNGNIFYQSKNKTEFKTIPYDSLK